MSEYEDLVELGFEGIDKFATKYHDKVYKHIPAAPQIKKRDAQHSVKVEKTQTYQQPRSLPEEAKLDVDQPLPPHPQRFENHNPAMYTDRRTERDYRDRGDDRYYEDERIYYKGPDAGAVVPRMRNISDRGGYDVSGQQQVQQYQPPAQYGNERDYYDRGRPQAQRRGSSWSPPRSEKHKHHNHESRARSRSRDKQHRILASVSGAIIGGLAGNQVRKGQKYETASTVVGAVIGGIGAREVAERWDDRRRKREQKQEDWEEEYGSDRDDRKDRNDRNDRDDRDDRSRGRNDRYSRDDRYDNYDRYDRRGYN